MVDWLDDVIRQQEPCSCIQTVTVGLPSFSVTKTPSVTSLASCLASLWIQRGKQYMCMCTYVYIRAGIQPMRPPTLPQQQYPWQLLSRGQ